MLDGLDRIDWASLTHAYGEASDVPDLLRRLLDPDPGVHEAALHDLFGNIWHQGTVYPATAAAVPFLYELLDDPGLPKPDGVAILLASIATGRGYLEVHAVGDYGEPTWRKILAGEGKSLEAEMARESAEIDAVRLAIAPELPRLIPFLKSDSPEIRESVAEALAAYPQHSAVSLPALEDAVEDEPDPETRAILLQHLRLLRTRRP